METFLFYILRASIAAAILFLCYKIFISRSTFHSLNRAVILSVFVVALILPFFTVELPENLFSRPTETNTLDLSAFENVNVVSEMPITPIAAEPKAEIPWQSILLSIYLSGVAFCLLRYLIGLLRIAKIIRTSRSVHLADGSSLYVSSQNIEPFSWMNYIVVGEKDFTADNKDIFKHEKAHVSHHHSLDLLFADVYCIAFWFNPFVWLLRKELRNVHEFQADAEVIKNRSDFREYQLLLIRHCVGEHKFSIANNFELNNLQKRIQMIMKTKSPKRAKWLYTSFIISIMMAVTVLSIETLQAKEPQKEDNEILTEDELKDKMWTAGTAILSDNVLYLSDAKIVDKKEATSNDTTKKSDLVIENEDKSNKLVIVGHGEMKNLLYVVDGVSRKSIDDINAEDIQKIEVLKGKAAIEVFGENGKNGVILITKKINSPENVIKIRGQKNAEPSLQPLYIVDGLEVKSISDIEPNTIESLSVLKDKTSTVIYGDKGKNGVIFITTKKEKEKEKQKSGAIRESFPIDNANEQLYILDGTLINKKQMEDIDPQNIENINVLKGTSVTALYGTRGINGVVMITTKNPINNRTIKVGELDVPTGDKMSIQPITAIEEKNGKVEVVNFDTPQLIILDDVEINKDQMEKLDKNSIESVTILKNKSAEAVYGEKGKNGVIIIKSKKKM